MLVSIIMPFYNHIELVHQRMRDFHNLLPVEDIEIILVNDGSTEDGIDGIVGFWQKEIARHKIRYIKNDSNQGFGYSMNRGAEKANGDILIFFSDDVVVMSDFTQEVVGLIGGSDQVLVGGEFLSNDTGWNTFPKCGVVPYLNGWLLACTKKAWEELGGFDLRYGISDYEDIDLCLTAVRKGFRLEPLQSSKLRHLGGQTAGYNQNREKRTLENREKFKEKWGL